MADDYDIEAFLEAQVESAGKGDGDAAEPSADKEKEKEKGNGSSAKSSKDKKDKENDEERSKSSRKRSRSRDRKDRDRSRDRDRSKRDRDRDRDRDRRRGRSRSRSRERRRRSRSRERRRSRSRERSPSPKDERTQEQIELDELTKDQRTVFVSQLVLKADERALRKFFTNFGKVRSVVMIRDKATNRHKGFAYVEMADLNVIPNVLMMNNQVPDFQKFPIAVAASQAEKNYLAKQEASKAKAAGAVPGAAPPAPGNRVYLGNLHPSITENDLQELLRPFGTVHNIALQRDDMGVSKGYAFVTFSRAEEAQAVMSQLSGVPLADRPIKVGPVTDTGAASANASGNWKLDDDEGAGLHLNAQSRAALMAKLGQAAGLQVPPMMAAQPAAVAAVPGMGTGGVPAIGGIPSQAILVKNMFDPAAESEEGWDLDIKDDVEDEVSKHGRVLHIHVEKNQPGGLVYILFREQEAATKAATGLHGRWFAGRLIVVDYMPPSQYCTRFPEAQQRLLDG